jgi:predicted Fe-Mo cluster-binding NifX family protein
MKLAIVTDDERTISQHFGRAPYYLVVSIEAGQVVGRERRDKPGHAQFAGELHGPDHPHGPGAHEHGRGSGSQSRHARMADVITDCQAVVCGGMGAGAYDNLRARGIQPIMTDIASIEDAVRVFVEGRIVDCPDRLH